MLESEESSHLCTLVLLSRVVSLLSFTLSFFLSGGNTNSFGADFSCFSDFVGAESLDSSSYSRRAKRQTRQSRQT